MVPRHSAIAVLIVAMTMLFHTGIRSSVRHIALKFSM